MLAVDGQQGGDTAGSLTTSALRALKPNPSIVIRVFNSARVQEAVLNAAQNVAARIFEEAGVKIEWHDCKRGGLNDSDPTCTEKVRLEDVILRIVPHFRPAAGHAYDAALGYAVGPYATVSYERVMDIAQNQRHSLALILGRAIAHEIGHILFRTTEHSPGGIMLAHWGPDELKFAANGNMVFTPEQSERLRSEVSARMTKVQVSSATQPVSKR